MVIGVGGILCDIFMMGVCLIVLLNVLCFGFFEDFVNVGLMEGVVVGIVYYGNCVGVLMVGGEVVFDFFYFGNLLVNVMVFGFMEIEEIVKFGVIGVGNFVVYVGSIIGWDGMGGVSFVSVEFSVDFLDDCFVV